MRTPYNHLEVRRIPPFRFFGGRITVAAQERGLERSVSWHALSCRDILESGPRTIRRRAAAYQPLIHQLGKLST